MDGNYPCDRMVLAGDGVMSRPHRALVVLVMGVLLAGVAAAAASLLPGITSDAADTETAHLKRAPHDHHGRTAHLRIWNDTGGLLYTTWPNETGPLNAYDHDPPHAVTLREDLGDVRAPFWEPLLPMMMHAPPNTTLRVANYTVPDLRLDRVVIPRDVVLDREGTLPRHDADVMLGTNLSAGDVVYFLGRIPLEVTAVGDDAVHYAFTLDEPSTFDVPRIQGLNVTARPEGGESVRFSLDAPTGAFTAHNNCALPQKFLEAGHYVVRQTSPDELVLDRYNGPPKLLLEAETVTVEVTFVDHSTSHAH